MKINAFIFSIVLSSLLSGCMSEKGAATGDLPVSAEVSLPRPSSFAYSQTTYIFGAGIAAPSQSPVSSNASVTYFAIPPLPLGLNIHPSTGVISGTPLNASPATDYTITAINTSGAVTTTISILVDATAPTAMIISDDGIDTKDGTQLHFTWTPSTDPESGIAKYEYSLGTSSGAIDVIGWTEFESNGPITLNGLSLVPGSVYFMNIKATNKTGLSTISSSDGINYMNALGVWASSKEIISEDDVHTYYDNHLYWCSSTACQSVRHDPVNHHEGIASTLFPKTSHLFFKAFDFYAKSEICSPSGCSDYGVQFNYGFPLFDISGSSSWYGDTNNLYICNSSTCNFLIGSDIDFKLGYQKISYSVSGYNIYVSKTGNLEIAEVSGTPTNINFPYQNGVEKIWRILNRRNELYLVSCSPTLCSDVSALNGAALSGANLIVSPSDNATWVETSTHTYYCTESGCTSILNSSSSYGSGSVAQQDGNALWKLDNTGRVRYCTKTSCGAALGRYLDEGKAGINGLWSVLSGSLNYCHQGACNSLLSGLQTNKAPVLNKHVEGAWITQADGIYYCSTTACNRIHALTSAAIDNSEQAADRMAQGAWFHEASTGNVYYCTTTACTNLPKPASLREVNFL